MWYSLNVCVIWTIKQIWCHLCNRKNLAIQNSEVSSGATDAFSQEFLLIFAWCWCGADVCGFPPTDTHKHTTTTTSEWDCAWAPHAFNLSLHLCYRWEEINYALFFLPTGLPIYKSTCTLNTLASAPFKLLSNRQLLEFPPQSAAFRLISLRYLWDTLHNTNNLVPVM